MNQQTQWFFERARAQYRVAVSNETSPTKRKAFESKNPRKQVFTKEELAKYFNSWEMLPYIVTRGSQKNYVEFMKIVDKKRPDKAFFEEVVAKAILFKTAEKEYGTGEKAIGDLRYLVVPYTLAFLNKITESKIDLHIIWQNQAVSDNLRNIIIDLLHKIDDFLRASAPGGLIGEWAKKEDCWKQLYHTDLQIDIGMLQGDFITRQKVRERHQTENEAQKALLIKEQTDNFYSIPSSIWEAIEIWGRTTKKMNSYQCSVLLTIAKKVQNRKEFSEKEVTTGQNILELVNQERPELLMLNGNNTTNVYNP